MKIKSVFLSMALIAMATSSFAVNQPIIIKSDAIQWQPAKDLPGAEVAVIAGNPQKHEPFVARVKLPANFQIPVHTHNINEYDTVISGAIYLGIGSKFDAESTQEINAGNFVMIPAHTSHYSLTKEETVLQISGIGPWGMIYPKKG